MKILLKSFASWPDIVKSAKLYLLQLFGILWIFTENDWKLKQKLNDELILCSCRDFTLCSTKRAFVWRIRQVIESLSIVMWMLHTPPRIYTFIINVSGKEWHSCVLFFYMKYLNSVYSLKMAFETITINWCSNRTHSKRRSIDIYFENVQIWMHCAVVHFNNDSIKVLSACLRLCRLEGRYDRITNFSEAGNRSSEWVHRAEGCL